MAQPAYIEPLYALFQTHPVVTTDSRGVSVGAIFFALRGDNFNGNQYAAAALRAGAVAVVIDDTQVASGEVAQELYQNPGATSFLVPDVLRALQELAAHHRRTLGLPILAITGSNGKTTTKELLGAILATKYRLGVTRGNLNNHIGVPLTLLSMNEHTQMGVVEMGANHCGEITLLCSIAQPNYGLITNIGRAHLEGFGGPEGVKRGKGELFDYLAATGGEAFYLVESEVLHEMVTARQEAGLRTLPYSAQALQATHDEHTPNSTAGTMHQAQENQETGGGNFLTLRTAGRLIHTHLIGEYNRNNVAAALAVGERFEVPLSDCISAIEDYQPDNNRSQRSVTAHNTLILDAYNANPSSMRAALENFTQEKNTRPKILILGDMRELGAYSADEHQAILSYVHTCGDPLAGVYLVGDQFPAACTELGLNTSALFQAFSDVAALRVHLEQHPLRDRLILIKGSRSIHLEQITELL